MGGLREYLAGETDGPGGVSGIAEKPCVRCGGPKPVGQGRKLCVTCAPPPPKPRVCKQCGETPVSGKGIQYCPDCKAFQLDAQKARKRARGRLRHGKPCSGCGRPKQPGRGARYCPACRRTRENATRPLAPCRDCESPVRFAGALLCSECHAAAYQRKLANSRAWNHAHASPSARPKRKRSERSVRLPALPLALLIERMIRKESMNGDEDAPTVVQERLAVHPRALWGWKNGDRSTVPLDTIDRVLTNAGRFWWEVWTEETVRVPLFTVTTYSHQMKTDRRGVPIKRRVKARSIPYGDAGPDLAMLAEVRTVMEGKAVRAA